jgi:hypothetical protein
MSETDHPVWSVYDRLRTARLNVKYYCARLARFEAISFWLDLTLLATAPTSAVAGLWFWDTDWGRPVWKLLAVIAALTAVVKPLLNLTKRIKDYETLVSGYRVLEFDLMQVKIGIEQKRKYDNALQADFKRAQDRERSLIAKIPESKEHLKVKVACRNEVDRELPSEAFFVPEE